MWLIRSTRCIGSTTIIVFARRSTPTRRLLTRGGADPSFVDARRRRPTREYVVVRRRGVVAGPLWDGRVRPAVTRCYGRSERRTPVFSDDNPALQRGRQAKSAGVYSD